MLILTYMFKHDTFYIFHPYFHKERGFGVPIFYLTGIIKKIDEIKSAKEERNHSFQKLWFALRKIPETITKIINYENMKSESIATVHYAGNTTSATCSLKQLP